MILHTNKWKYFFQLPFHLPISRYLLCLHLSDQSRCAGEMSWEIPGVQRDIQVTNDLVISNFSLSIKDWSYFSPLIFTVSLDRGPSLPTSSRHSAVENCFDYMTFTTRVSQNPTLWKDHQYLNWLYRNSQSSTDGLVCFCRSYLGISVKIERESWTLQRWGDRTTTIYDFSHLNL